MNKNKSVERTNRTMAMFCWLTEFKVKFSRVVGLSEDRMYHDITAASQERIRYLIRHADKTRVHCNIEFHKNPMLSVWNGQTYE